MPSCLSDKVITYSTYLIMLLSRVSLNDSGQNIGSALFGQNSYRAKTVQQYAKGDCILRYGCKIGVVIEVNRL